MLLDNKGERVNEPPDPELALLGVKFMHQVNEAFNDGCPISSAAEETLDMIEEWGKQDG